MMAACAGWLTPAAAPCCPVLRCVCPADLVLKGVVRVEDIAPIDEKVDVWSFGVTVYELVTGVVTVLGS